MAMNSPLSKIESKQTKQTVKTEIIIGIEIVQKVISWERKEETGGKCSGTKKYKLVGREQTGDVKNSIGNGEAKELICMTHRYELRGGLLNKMWVPESRAQVDKLGQL